MQINLLVVVGTMACVFLFGRNFILRLLPLNSHASVAGLADLPLDTALYAPPSHSDSPTAEDFKQELAILRQARQALEDGAQEEIDMRFVVPAIELGTQTQSFRVPDELLDIVDFWAKIYGEYSSDKIVFYHRDNVGIVYSVLDVSTFNNEFEQSKKQHVEQAIQAETERLKTIFKRLDLLLSVYSPDVSGLPAEEQIIAQKLLGNTDHIDATFSSLDESLAYRRGSVDSFQRAIERSGQYMPFIEQVFRERGLPSELTVLPLIESAFVPTAQSSKGAVGLWQFIETTGKKYLNISSEIDERKDPFLSTYAAASYLVHEFNAVQNWPLAINAYNTGAGRILDAMTTLETKSIADIMRYYQGEGYGFESRNYYAQFLAALRLYRNRHTAFQNLKPEPYQDTVMLTLPSEAKFFDLAKLAGINSARLAKLNPALSESVTQNQVLLPAQSLIHVPRLMRDDFLLAFQELQRVRDETRYHYVTQGESWEDIAKFYDQSLETLQALNVQKNTSAPRKGDLIRLNTSPAPSLQVLQTEVTP